MLAQRHVLWLPLASFLLAPVVAAAQPVEGPPRVAVAAGAGIALLLHADFDVTPWAWDADVRVAGSRRVLFEAAAGEWRHTRTREATGIPFGSTPGAIGRLEEVTIRAQRAFQANVLATGGVGRVRLTGGGGVGVLQHRRRTRQTLDDCAPQIPCGTFENASSSVRGTAQAVGGLEVSVAFQLSVYGQVRLIVPLTDAGGTDARMVAGLRWGFGGSTSDRNRGSS